MGIEALSDIARASQSAFTAGGGTAFTPYPLKATSSGQSSFAISGGYTPGYTLCFLNGASFTEYTQTSGTNIVLDSAVAAKVVVDDELLVVAFNTLSIGMAADSDKLDGFDSSYFATAAALAALTTALANRIQTRDSGWLTAPTAGGIGTVTFSSALPDIPTEFALLLKAKTATSGFSVGDVVPKAIGFDHAGTVAAYGCQIQAVTASGLELRVGTLWSAFSTNKTSGAAVSFNLADWDYRIIARYIP